MRKRRSVGDKGRKDKKEKGWTKELSKQLPMDVDAEKSILGAILLDNSYAPKAFSSLKPEEFFIDGHRAIYEAMQLMTGEGIPIDFVTLSSHLQTKGQLERVNGSPYISALSDGMPRVSNIGHYVKIVKAKSLLRNLIHTAYEVEKAAFLEEGAPEEIVEKAVQSLLALSSGIGGPLIRSWYDVSQSAFNKIQTEHDFPENATRINTGITDLDRQVEGFRKKEFVVIVGPTSHGKTLLAQQLAVQAEEDGNRGLIFSAEMPGEQVVARQIAYDARLDFWKIRNPERLSDEELSALKSASGKMRSKLTIVERDITPANIWGISEAYKKSKGLDFIVVDYDQLVIEAGIDPDEDEEGFFRHQRNFNLEAKRVCERLDICFILLSQLRKVPGRVAQGGKPTIDDIYGDSSIRNQPHTILWVIRQFFFHGFKAEFERKATVYVVKSRNGRVCRVDLTFDQNRVRLVNEEPSEKHSKKDTSPPPEESTKFKFEG